VVTMPGFLAVVLPFALLVSLLYVFGKLHRANELTAMRAAGVGFLRLTAPVWVVGVAGCVLMWGLNTTVVPWSNEKSMAMREALQFSHESTRGIARDRIGAIESVGFDNRPAHRMWFFNRYSRGVQRGYGVSVSELDAGRHETRRLVAATAWRDDARHAWVFQNGRELRFAAETGELSGDEPFREKVEPRYDEDPDLMLLIDRRPIDLSFRQLRELITYLETEHSPKVVDYAVRYFGLIADTLAPLIVIAIAIPFAVTGVRVNPAVGVSKSIGLYVLYYALSTFAASLAKQGVVEPVVAAWLPSGGMLVLAGWLLLRMR